MSDHDPNGADRAPQGRRRSTWIIGLVAVAAVLVLGVIYGLGNHGGRSSTAANDGTPASTAHVPAPPAPGGAGRR